MRVFGLPRLIVALGIVLYSLTGPLCAQSVKSKRAAKDNCEEISGKLDFVGNKYAREATKDSFIIILSTVRRQGSIESAGSAVQDATKYLNKFHRIDGTRIKAGISKSDNPTSEIEFYINGEFVISINVADRSRLCFGIGETFDRTTAH